MLTHAWTGSCGWDPWMILATNNAYNMRVARLDGGCARAV
jgi:hypothetical protein